MDLVYSVALLGLAAVLSVFVLLSVRMPVEPVWATEGLVANVWCVAITGLISFGTSFGVRFALTMKAQPLGLREVAVITGLLAVFYGILRWMAPRRPLAGYAAQIAENSGGTRAPSAPEIIELASPVDDGRPDKPTVPKAA